MDPDKRQMLLKTQNLTFGRHISVDESLHYLPHPTDPHKTLLKQEASVSVHGVPLSYYMEDMITSKISANANKGRQGLEWVISKINSEVKLRIFMLTMCNMSYLFFSFESRLNRSKELRMQLAKALMISLAIHISRLTI